jgi:hypothetical protein
LLLRTALDRRIEKGTANTKNNGNSMLKTNFKNKN